MPACASTGPMMTSSKLSRAMQRRILGHTSDLLGNRFKVIRVRVGRQSSSGSTYDAQSYYLIRPGEDIFSVDINWDFFHAVLLVYIYYSASLLV